jgi:hypothetical protein
MSVQKQIESLTKRLRVLEKKNIAGDEAINLLKKQRISNAIRQQKCRANRDAKVAATAAATVSGRRTNRTVIGSRAGQKAVKIATTTTTTATATASPPPGRRANRTTSDGRAGQKTVKVAASAAAASAVRRVDRVTRCLISKI